MMAKKQGSGPVIPMDKASRTPRVLRGPRSKPELLTPEARADETALERARRERLAARNVVSDYMRIPHELMTKLRVSDCPTAISEIAKVLTLEDLGVTIPPTVPRKFHARFEEGFRHGLSSNVLRNFRKSYGEGFRFAKLYIREINPRHILAVPISGGRAQMRFVVEE